MHSAHITAGTPSPNCPTCAQIKADSIVLDEPEGSVTVIERNPGAFGRQNPTEDSAFAWATVGEASLAFSDIGFNEAAGPLAQLVVYTRDFDDPVVRAASVEVTLDDAKRLLNVLAEWIDEAYE